MKNIREVLRSWNKQEFGMIDEKIYKCEELIYSIDNIVNGRELSNKEIGVRRDV